MEQGLSTSVMATAAELTSMLWMELTMVVVAVLGYALLYGGLATPKLGKKVVEEPSSEPEKVARELQIKLTTGDPLAAYKLWQRVKSFEQAPAGDALIAAVEAMRRLGRSVAEVAGEFKSALEGNPALRDEEAASELLEALEKEGPRSA